MRSMQSPIATRLRTTLCYTSRFLLSTFSTTDQQMRLNSLYDPDFTGTGHQPKGFDQLAALYQRYRVYHTRYAVEVALSLNSNLGGALVVVPTNGNSGYTSVDDAAEATFAKCKTFNISNIARLAGKIDLAELNGKTRAAYMSDDTTQALVSTNPTEVLNLHLVVGMLDGSTVLGGSLFVRMWFDCEFSDPLELGQS